MYNIFENMNPNNDILRCDKIIEYFTKIFSMKFSEYDELVLKACARKFVFLRIRCVNEIVESLKRLSESAPNTARGARKQAQLELG